MCGKWPGSLIWGSERSSFDFKFTIVGDPSSEAWSRAHRYASWMRRVEVYDWPVRAEDTYRKLRLNSPAGGWFPALQSLSWTMTKTNLPYADLFFSPHLKTISVYNSWSPRGSGVPRDLQPSIASAISMLPTSALRSLCVGYIIPWADLTDSISSVVLRCGPSLAEFTSTIPLSEAAMNHLIQLPHLRRWHIGSPPPSYSIKTLPLVFPPLAVCILGEGVGRGWIPLFERLEHSVSPTQGVTPLSEVKESLEILTVESRPGTATDASFTSTIQIFRNLVDLNVDAFCHSGGYNYECTFKLNNDNVAELVMALPRLESLALGRPCFKNTCATTVACLLPISVRCLKLRSLLIHFNTTTIHDDFKNISGDHRFQELRLLPRCTLSLLDTWETPLTLDEPEFETVASGMVDIFPSLERCIWFGESLSWYTLNGRIKDLQGT